MNGFKKTVLAATAAMVLGLAANAQALLIDNFNNTTVSEIESLTDNLGTIVQQAGTTNVPFPSDTSLTNNVRFVEVARTGGTSTQGHASVSVADGSYQHSQDSGVSGWSASKWTFDTANFTAGGSFAVLVDYDADLAGGQVHVTLWDVNNNSDTVGSGILGAGVGQTSFAFAGFAGVDLTNIVMARMEVDGRNVMRLDVDVDIVQTVPEPGAMLLMGGGLLGLGLWRKLRV